MDLEEMERHKDSNMGISHRMFKREADEMKITKEFCKECLVQACCREACSGLITFIIFKKADKLYDFEKYKKEFG